MTTSDLTYRVSFTIYQTRCIPRFFTHFVPLSGALLLVKHCYGDIEYSSMIMGAMSTSLGHCHASVQPECVIADGLWLCLVLNLMFFFRSIVYLFHTHTQHDGWVLYSRVLVVTLV
jgi:hypothetical protein